MSWRSGSVSNIWIDLGQGYQEMSLPWSVKPIKMRPNRLWIKYDGQGVRYGVNKDVLYLDSIRDASVIREAVLKFMIRFGKNCAVKIMQVPGEEVKKKWEQ